MYEQFEKYCLLPNQISKENINFFDSCLNYNSHKRYEISLKTNDLDIMHELRNKGWNKKQTPQGTKLKAPEVWLIDLTDPFKHDLFKSKKLLIDFYNFLMDKINTNSLNILINDILLKNNIFDLDFKVIMGESISYEIRVVGSDERIYSLRELLLDYFLGTTEEKYLINKNLCLENKVQNSFFEKIINMYSLEHICEKSKIKNIEIKNIKINFEEYDYIFLIPTSCFKYCGLLKNCDPKKIVFVRTHASNNFLIEETFNFPANLKDKKCLVMDVAYSGKTLNFMKNYLCDLGAKVQTLALFPKSKLAFENSDYCIILDKLFFSRDILDLSMEEIYAKMECESNVY